MDGFWYGMMNGYPYGYPFAGMFIWMCLVWVIQLIVGYFVYRDAKERGVNPVLWFVLVIFPMIGWLFLVIYVIIQESTARDLANLAVNILGILLMFVTAAVLDRRAEARRAAVPASAIRIRKAGSAAA